MQQQWCRPCMHFWNKYNLKPSVARKLAVKHTSFVCMTVSFLPSGGFVKLFHIIPWFFHDYSGFFKFHDFSMHGFLRNFPGFQWFPELVGTHNPSGSGGNVESILFRRSGTICAILEEGIMGNSGSDDVQSKSLRTDSYIWILGYFLC